MASVLSSSIRPLRELFAACAGLLPAVAGQDTVDGRPTPRTSSIARVAGLGLKRLHARYSTRCDPSTTGTNASSGSRAAGGRMNTDGSSATPSPRAISRVMSSTTPASYATSRAVAAAGTAQLRTCQAHADRVYLSPPALLEPGERTGRYRRGTDTLLTGADGRSWISAEDLAVAVVDELETRGSERLITVVHRDERPSA
ncbi:hypothetical protein [Streptomyces mirabilis]